MWTLLIKHPVASIVQWQYAWYGSNGKVIENHGH